MGDSGISAFIEIGFRYGLNLISREPIADHCPTNTDIDMAEALGTIFVAQVSNEAVEVVLELHGERSCTVPPLGSDNIWG
jgi:hypothetical protein